MNSIKLSNKNIQVRVSVFLYLDTDHPDKDMYIAYCPSLNLVGYGNGEEKAKQDFQWMMSDYLCDMLRQGTLEEDLRSLGWKAVRKSFNEPKVSDMMSSNKQLEDVVNRGNYHQISVDTVCSALA